MRAASDEPANSSSEYAPVAFTQLLDPPSGSPREVAALERGNIDAYAVWEPWVTRGFAAVKNTKVLTDQEGILGHGRHQQGPHAGRLQAVNKLSSRR